MRRAAYPLSLLLLLSLVGAAAAEDQTDPIYLLLDKALRIKVTARIFGEDEAMVWNMETSYLTISGRTVSIPLKGSNIVVLFHVTPYREELGDLLLIAQGQVWYTPTGTEEVQYLSTLKSIPISLGEKVHFFPLGRHIAQTEEVKNNEGDDSRIMTDVIELQVEILPYQEDSHQEPPKE